MSAIFLTQATRRFAALARTRPGLPVLSVLLTAAGIGWIQLLHGSHSETAGSQPSALLHAFRDGSLALPAVAIGLLVATHLARRVHTSRFATDVIAPNGLTSFVDALFLAGGASVALAAGSPFHAVFFGEGEASIAYAAQIALTALPVTLVVAALCLAAPAALGAGTQNTGSVAPAGTAAPKGRAKRATTSVLAALITATSFTLLPAPAYSAADGPCPADSRVVYYDIAAFETVIPINGWGDHLPSGLVYALRDNDARNNKADIVANPNLTQPITIRANVGDCIKVSLRNDITGRNVGIHADGLVNFDPKTSDGAAIGNNPDTTVATGSTRTYTWYADHEGEAPLVDLANIGTSNPNDEASTARGLYGALIVHPKGSTWHNSVTGESLLKGNHAVESNVFADIHTEDAAKSYRSYAMVFMDENEGVMDARGRTPTFPTTGLEDSTFGVNYRSEPLRNRLRAVLDHRSGKTIKLPNGKTYLPTDPFCDGFVPELGRIVDDPGARCVGEEMHLQSWPFGDAGKLISTDADGKISVDSDLLIPKAYVGDPIRFSVIHPGAEETHPWHQHTQRWFADPDNTNSPRKDVQSVGPGEAYPLVIEGGAGGVQGTIGDSIFHCHLYPHFAQGFWGNLRIFDLLRDGSQTYPDGTPMEELQPLPGRTPDSPTASKPGFPLFVKGDVGQRAYRPPHGVVKDDFSAIRRPGDTVRGPNPLEAASLPALDPNKPGAAYTDVCPASAPLRTYKPHAIDVKLEYNSSGWHDPQGRIYVEESHRDAVLAGTEKPEPYTIRARVGECVQLLTTNDLHLDDDPLKPIDHMGKKDGAFASMEETTEISTHVHLVEFDELGSDGTSVGWNYVQAAMPGQTYGFRWYVDQALRTVFFHDHQYANGHQQKGLFAAMNVQPADATWTDPKTGLPSDGTGTVADIHSPSAPDFREVSLFYQDRTPMWNKDGKPIAAPNMVNDYGADQGGVAINYRNEPFLNRVTAGAPGAKGDPAYIYSSAVHGDPSTPVLKAYTGDPVVIRHVAGAHEEVHTFNLHGHNWLAQPDNPASSLVDSQSIALAEWMNYEIQGGRLTRNRLTPEQTLSRAVNDAQNGTPMIVNGGAGAAGDYLYGSEHLDDQYAGMWGIFRVSDAPVSDLKPLPDRAAPASTKVWPALAPGQPLNAKPVAAVNKCPAGSPLRTYNVNAIQHDIVYNARTGLHDPNGLAYVLAEEEGAVRSGQKQLDPLTIRANAGDCLQVTLTNKLPVGGLAPHTGDVPMMFDKGNDENPLRIPAGLEVEGAPIVSKMPAGDRVSLHAGMVRYEPTRADGATVGYNFDQTVAPGDSMTMFWYVPAETEGATANLVDFGDRRGHRHHGLFGGLLIEPKGSTWTSPTDGKPVVNSTVADIKWTDASGQRRAFREFALNWQDGLNLKLRDGGQLPTEGPIGDPYEAGNRGINYRSEPFFGRQFNGKDGSGNAWYSMSSAHHGDPSTPILRANAGDDVRIRMLSGGDRGRAHSLMVSGHRWHTQANDPTSLEVSALGSFMTGNAASLNLTGGAGGPRGMTGDFLIRDGLLPNQASAGLWSVLRVLDKQDRSLQPLG